MDGSSARRPAVVAFVGHSGSGKTEVLTETVRRLTERGYAVATVKHAPALDEVDREGHDSARHRAAGATRSLLWGSADAALFWRHGGEGNLAETIERLFPDADLVLVEGWKRGPYPKIEVYRRAAARPDGPLAGEIDVAAVVTDDPVAVPDGVELLARRDPERIVVWLEERMDDPAAWTVR